MSYNDEWQQEHIDSVNNRYGLKCPDTSLLFCNMQCTVPPRCSLSPRYPAWCLTMFCPNPSCLNKWNVCLKCAPFEKQHSRLVKQQKVGEHYERYHNPTTIVSTVYTNDCEGGFTATNDTREDYDNINEIFSENPEYAKFFIHERSGKGSQYLVAKQFTDSDNPDLVSTEDATLHLCIANIAYGLSKAKNMRLAQIFCIMQGKTNEQIARIISDCENGANTNDLKHSYPSTISCGVPVTPNDLRRYARGPKSILRNIPSPTVYMAQTGCAYVRLRDVLTIYLSYGLNPDYVSSIVEAGPRDTDGTVGTVWESRKALEAIRKLPASEGTARKILVAEWSDGCDPNGRNKGNRGSVHVITVSLFTHENRNDYRYSFLMAVGREGSDHSEVRRQLYDDLEELETVSKFYDGQKMIDLQVIFHATLQDRPERSECTGFGYHNGEYTTRWGYCCPIPETLHSCEDCKNFRLQNADSATSNKECDDCHDWEFDTVAYSAPEDFPEELLEEDEEFLDAKKITFPDLKQSAALAHERLVSGAWQKKNAKSYLRAMGINAKLVVIIINNATSETPDELDTIIPPKWLVENGMELHIDAIMHLVFLGVSQTLGMMVREILAHCGKYTTFHDLIPLKELRAMSLEWCRIWTFGSKETPYGPWVSENSLAYVRIFKMVYSVLDIMGKNVDNHNVDKDQMNRIKVTKFATSAWVAVVSRLMQSVVDDNLINDVERHIKIFLSAMDDLDALNATIQTSKNEVLREKGKPVRKKISKRKIASTSNMTSLLNLPEMMRKFGPPRNYWEGGYKGEGIFQDVKPIITQGTHMPWFATTAMDRYYKEKGMSMIIRNFDEENEEKSSSNDEDSEVTKNENFKRYGAYYKYASIEKLRDAVTGGEPISGLLLEDGTICCGVFINKKLFKAELIIHDENGKEDESTWYAPLCVGSLDTMDGIAIETVVLVLPDLSKKEKYVDENSAIHHYYYIVNRDWKERFYTAGKISFRLPRLDGVTY